MASKAKLASTEAGRGRMSEELGKRRCYSDTTTLLPTSRGISERPAATHPETSERRCSLPCARSRMGTERPEFQAHDTHNRPPNQYARGSKGDENDMDVIELPHAHTLPRDRGAKPKKKEKDKRKYEEEIFCHLRAQRGYSRKTGRQLMIFRRVVAAARRRTRESISGGPKSGICDDGFGVKSSNLSKGDDIIPDGGDEAGASKARGGDEGKIPPQVEAADKHQEGGDGEPRKAAVRKNKKAVNGRKKPKIMIKKNKKPCGMPDCRICGRFFGKLVPNSISMNR